MASIVSQAKRRGTVQATVDFRVQNNDPGVWDGVFL
jgi:hypothetical protein